MKQQYKIVRLGPKDSFFKDSAKIVGSIIEPTHEDKLSKWEHSFYCFGATTIVSCTSDFFETGEEIPFHSIIVKKVQQALAPALAHYTESEETKMTAKQYQLLLMLYNEYYEAFITLDQNIIAAFYAILYKKD